MEPEEAKEQRIDTASRLIKATASRIYQALMTPSAISKWKAPQGMSMEIFHFNARVNGTYRLALSYNDRKQKGKSGNNSDMVIGRFTELIQDQKIIESIHFQSQDPAFAGEMTLTTEIIPEKNGTRVTFTATNVPVGITAEDHSMGMNGSLENLAKYLE